MNKKYKSKKQAKTAKIKRDNEIAKNTTTLVNFRFHNVHDSDILKRLGEQDNKCGYFKRLVRADIAKNPDTATNSATSAKERYKDSVSLDYGQEQELAKEGIKRFKAFSLAELKRLALKSYGNEVWKELSTLPLDDIREVLLKEAFSNSPKMVCDQKEYSRQVEKYFYEFDVSKAKEDIEKSISQYHKA